MAMTLSGLRTNRVGTAKQVAGTLTLDASYPTGGLAFPLAVTGLYQLDTIEVEMGLGYVLRWDRSSTTPKIMAYQGDNDNVADAPLIEVPNTTNLSTVIAIFIATGR